MSIRSASLARRLDAKTVKKPGGCWEWTGARNRKGYGHISNGRIRGKKVIDYTHRVAYELAFGPVPETMLVLHSCDNPPCVNPAHLRVGTYSDNQRDAFERGRKRFPERRGEQIPWARLTEEDVRLIRHMAIDGDRSISALAREFGVGRSTLGHLLAGRSWRHVQ